MTQYTIGIDIGGTHTDAVLIDNRQQIVKKIKTITTDPIDIGFQDVINKLMDGRQWQDISTVFVGTTHATNAILEARDLYKVGVLRMTGYTPRIKPCSLWPAKIKQAVLAGCVTIGGGFECDGRQISAFQEEEAKRALETLIDSGAESIAATSAFSPLFPEQELKLVALAEKLGIPLSLSSEMGTLGFIERENAAILNAALKKPLAKGFSALQNLCKAPLFLTQNSGTILDVASAIQYPILTLSAGPTNSFYGAAKLSNYEHAVVIDIGGTSTDIGLIKNGFPRRSLGRSYIGGIALNFSMPDVLAIALGGGSYVDFNAKTIGPHSCARKLKQQALCFGGDSMTLTDLAVCLYPDLIPEATPPKLCNRQAAELMYKALSTIREGALYMAGKEPPPILLVGGGASLFKHISNDFVIPEHADVANAYGSALAEIAHTEEKIASLSEQDKMLADLEAVCLQKTIAKGADPKKTRLIDVQILPYHYIPGQLGRMIVTAAGPPEKIATH